MNVAAIRSLARETAAWKERAATWIAAIVPAIVVCFANARFVWNHFYADGPYLLDAGLLSGVFYRRGLVPHHLPIESTVPTYFGIHVSPLVSLASVVSNVVPLPRVEWFCLVLGLLYAALAVAPALLVRPRTAGGAVRVIVASLAFAFGGQVLAAMGYPHHEIFVAAGIAVMLAGAATGRSGVAWAGLAMAIATREDGGVHAALFAAAVVAAGDRFPLPRRTTVRIALAGVGAAALAFAIQRALFVSVDLVSVEYVGSPAFAHLDASVLARRAGALVVHARFVTYPFLATVALAIARRDARYLLGWAAALPWFVANFFAAQELKSAFEIYTGFPFVASVFWVGAYGVAARDRAPLLPLAVVSIAATVGFAASRPEAFAHIARASFVRGETNPTAIRALAERLRADPHAFGRVFIDPSVACWTLESTAPEDLLQGGVTADAIAAHDGVVYFRSWIATPTVDAVLARSPYRRCGQIPGTIVHACVREDRELPPDFAPESEPAIARRP